MLKLCLAAATVCAALIQPVKAGDRSRDVKIVEHPRGCPKRLFCGCGVSVKVFGKPVRELFLAANWRKFAKAKPGAGMVAWRRGHVFYIIEMVEKNVALAFDPNSGRHLTRIHRRSLAGFRVVDPRLEAVRSRATRMT